MSAVAKAAFWRKCRDCEETLLHRICTGCVVVASAPLVWIGCTANSKSGAAASWEIDSSSLHAPLGWAWTGTRADCELYRGVSVHVQVQVHSRVARVSVCPCLVLSPS